MNGSRIFKFANHLCNTETSLPLSSTTTTRILQLKWCITSSSCKPNAVSRPSIRFWLAPKFSPAGEEAGQNGFHLDGKEPCVRNPVETCHGASLRGSMPSRWEPFLPASSPAGLNFGASHDLIDGLDTAFGLQKPYVMHHLFGKILIVVVDDGGYLILNPNND